MSTSGLILTDPWCSTVALLLSFVDFMIWKWVMFHWPIHKSESLRQSLEQSTIHLIVTQCLRQLWHTWCWENARKELKITVGYNNLFLFSIPNNQFKINSLHRYHYYKRPKHLCHVSAYSNRKDIWNSKSDNILIMNAVPINHFVIFIGLTHKDRFVHFIH